MRELVKTIRSIVAVSSCKGGVGKSTVAAHLALELAQRGLKVGLLDCDIHGPSVPTLFNLQNENVHVNDKKQFLPIEKLNLKIMSFGFLLGDAPAVMRGPIVTRYVQQILLNTAWGNLDYLLIDMPPGTGDVQLTITQTIPLDGAIIVTTPQSLSLADVSRGIIMFERVRVPILGVVENMSYFICDNCSKKHFIFGSQGAKTLQQRFGVDILAELPLDKKMIEPIDEYISYPQITKATDQLLKSVKDRETSIKQIPKVEMLPKELKLTWPDGSTAQVSFRELRLSCQCALCVNEITGKKVLKEKNIREDIAPKEIFPLGNYALAITWNDGHSSGIYPYQNIKELNKKSVNA